MTNVDTMQALLDERRARIETLEVAIGAFLAVARVTEPGRVPDELNDAIDALGEVAAHA